MIRGIFLFSVLLFFYSCKESAPSGIIKPKKMELVLWDIVRADILAQELVKKDSSRSQAEQNKRLTNEVFLIHHITREEFDKSYAYYIRHPDLLRNMLDSISAQQTRITYTEVSTKPEKIKQDSILHK